MLDSETLQCVVPLVLIAIVWFVLVQTNKEAGQSPVRSLTISTALSREEVEKIVVKDILPRSFLSKSFNWTTRSWDNELNLSGYPISDGVGCLVMLITGIIPGYLLLLFTGKRTERVTVDFSQLADAGQLIVTTRGKHASKITEKLIPKLEPDFSHFRWYDAVDAAITSEGTLNDRLPEQILGTDQTENEQGETDTLPEIQKPLDQAFHFIDQNALAEALHECQIAIQLHPKSAEAFNLLGIILDSSGKRREAIAAYKQAVGFDSDFADAQENLAEALQEDENEIRFLRSPESQLAFDAFRRAVSQASMDQAVAQYPLMKTNYFVTAVRVVIARQVPTNAQASFEQRLAWLEATVEKERAGQFGGHDVI